MADLALVNCRQLVTVTRPDLGIIRDGAMLVRGDRIERVGTRSEIEPLIGPDCEVVDAGGRVVMPGFVDAHTHVVFAGNRAGEFEQRCAGASYREIAAAGGGIRATVRATRAATEDELIEAARPRIEWMLRSGTTTAEVKSGYGLSLEDELKMLRAIRRLNDAGPLRLVPTFLGAHEVPDEYRDRRSEYLDLIVNEMLPCIAAEKLAEYCDAFCEEGVFTVAETSAFSSGPCAWARFAAARRSVVELWRRTTGRGTARHNRRSSGADRSAGIAALAAAGVQPVLLPGSVFALGLRRYPDARAMIDAGLAVVLATDFNPGSSPTPSMPLILFSRVHANEDDAGRSDSGGNHQCRAQS